MCVKSVGNESECCDSEMSMHAAFGGKRPSMRSSGIRQPMRLSRVARARDTCHNTLCLHTPVRSVGCPSCSHCCTVKLADSCDSASRRQSAVCLCAIASSPVAVAHHKPLRNNKHEPHQHKTFNSLSANSKAKGPNCMFVARLIISWDRRTQSRGVRPLEQQQPCFLAIFTSAPNLHLQQHSAQPRRTAVTPSSLTWSHQMRALITHSRLL